MAKLIPDTKFFSLLACMILTQFMGMGTAVAQPFPSSNLIVVLTDDLSVDLLNASLDNGRLPNIQQYLVTEGVSFENAYVTNPICCSSRATLLRGQYSHNHNVLDNKTDAYYPGVQPGILSPGWLPEGNDPGLESSTIATWLQSAGYHTGFIGRYLNGYGICGPNAVCMEDDGGWPTGEPDPRRYIPAGWDNWQALLDISTYRVYNYSMNDNGLLVTYGNTETDYQTDVLAQLAAQFIDDTVRTGKPIFLLLSPFAPHIEPETGTEGRFSMSIRPAPRHEHLIDWVESNDELPLPQIKPSVNELDISDKPSCSHLPSLREGFNHCVGDYPPMTSGPGGDIVEMVYQYKSMMAAMMAVDDMIGTLMERLVANNIDNNTVIIFTSDNGWLYGEHRAIGKEVGYEESIRVPLLIRSPDHATGVVASQLVLNNDLAPTLAALGGVTPPYDPDGTSLVPLLNNPQTGDWHRKAFLIERFYTMGFGATTYSAIRYKDSTNNIYYSQLYSDLNEPDTITAKEFYDLNIDPYQMNSPYLDPGSITGFSAFIALFKDCQGQFCRLLEGAQ